MDDERDYVKLVEQARLGQKESLDRLAGRVRGRLYAYVYRTTLDHSYTQDIVQESLLEMLKIFDNLEKGDRFWPWLRGIAFNKMLQRHEEQLKRREVSMSDVEEPQSKQKDDEAGLAKLVSDELKQVVVAAMKELKPRHRRVLAMRCYEEMPYSEIAELMGCSELGVRVLFYRAKRALLRGLNRRGLGKGFLITTLVLFGKMTAPSEAAAAEVSVTASTAKVGVIAGLIGAAGTKTAVVSLTAAGVVAVGTIMATSGPEEAATGQGEQPAGNSYVAPSVTQPVAAIQECWYYFPKSADGPVMMRMMKAGSRGKPFHCAWRQNEQVNNYFDRRDNTIYINNHRMWRSDLKVWRLPTDRPELTEFLSKVEGQGERMEYVRAEGEGLLVITGRDGDGNGNRSRIIRQRHVLDEEYFRYDCPRVMKTVDNRDTMHRRSWTFFRIDGELNGLRMSGTGRLPFVYAASQAHTPWLKLEVGHRLKIADSGDEALVYDNDGAVVASYPGGSFFKGLTRPWVGLHTIDTIRRDAAEERVWFETKYNRGEEKAEIILTCGQGKLVYTIDMEKDIIDKITISTNNGKEGELRFSYLQDIDEAGSEFVGPRITRSYGTKRRESRGILWLLTIMFGG
ncbi:MAG: RNA polymerase sigma factor [Planctomycetota bacterium]|jgi:RNA polymerase sigma-70 factor (ECF subfamily)